MINRQIRSDYLRRNFREVINAVEHGGEHVMILRYDTPSAVLVPFEWYQRTKQRLEDEARALADA